MSNTKVLRASDVSEIEAVLSLFLGFVQAAFAISDGGLGPVAAVWKLLPLIGTIKPAIANLSKIGPEIAGLDEAAREQLKSFVVDNFSISNKQIQNWIVTGLSALIDLSAVQS